MKSWIWEALQSFSSTNINLNHIGDVFILIKISWVEKVPVRSLMCSSIRRHHLVDYVLVPLLSDWSETSQLHIIGTEDCSCLWGAHQSLHLVEGRRRYYPFSFYLFKVCIMYSSCFYTSCSLVIQCFAKRFQIPVDWWFPRLCSITPQMRQCLKACLFPSPRCFLHQYERCAARNY